MSEDAGGVFFRESEEGGEGGVREAHPCKWVEVGKVLGLGGDERIEV